MGILRKVTDLAAARLRDTIGSLGSAAPAPVDLTTLPPLSFTRLVPQADGSDWKIWKVLRSTLFAVVDAAGNISYHCFCGQRVPNTKNDRCPNCHLQWRFGLISEYRMDGESLSEFIKRANEESAFLTIFGIGRGDYHSVEIHELHLPNDPCKAMYPTDAGIFNYLNSTTPYPENKRYI